MSDKHHKVLAIKCRPQTFEDVVGQPHVTRTLQNAIKLKRIAHAYLFTGARGVGKTSVARILAKSLNCENSPEPTPTPCKDCIDSGPGCCSNCREIAKSNSIDVLEFDGASNRGIDNIRELRETVRYRPAKGRYKVYIIDEVHMLTTEAFNALLKTLEEPPRHVVFIFATTEPHKIPATILSRCQRFDFRRVTLTAIVEHLKKITEKEAEDAREGEPAKEAVRFSDTVLYAIAREADGSMRDAQSLLEQLLAFSGDGLPDEEILDILGVIDRRSILRAGEAVISGDAEGCLDLVEDIYRRGIDSRRFCRHLCDHFRNLLLFTIGDAREKRLDLPDEEKKLLREQAAGTTPDSLHVYFQMLLRGEEEIHRSSMPKIALEMLLLRMAQLPRLESLDAVLDRIAELESTLKRECAGGSPGRAASPGSGKQPAPKTDIQKPGIAPSASGERAPESPAPDTHTAPSSKNSEANQGTGPVAGASIPPPPTSVEAPPMPAREGPPVAAGAVFSCDMDEPPPYVRDLYHDAGMVSEEPGHADSAHRESPALDPAGAVERWPEFIRFLENNYPMLWAKVAHCGVKAAPGGGLELEVPEIFQGSTNGAEFLQKLAEASDAFFGCKFEWVIIKKQAGPKSVSAQGAKSSKSSGKQVMNHPAVQQAIEILGAELVEVKPFRGPGPGAPRGGKKTGRG